MLITGVAEGAGVGRDPGLDGVVDHFTLPGDEAGWLRNRTGATRLGFAVRLKFPTWRGRFPKMRLELPPDAVERVAKQAGVAAFARSKREVFKSSCSNRCRSGLMKLPGVLDFRSSNDQHKPVMDALRLIERHKDSSATYLPLGETVPFEGVVRKDWTELAIFTPGKGTQASHAHRVRGGRLPGPARLAALQGDPGRHRLVLRGPAPSGRSVTPGPQAGAGDVSAWGVSGRRVRAT
ncbi:hypothetical protein SUDANB58_05911 (plasmid) [Streptomyces sp. enrichment culture]|uniref:DUF4158 domain-containing protein n=1 Tax=Streptomyces sp. enrichment culture TaxID=1795815 RepID=UPI003F548B54